MNRAMEQLTQAQHKAAEALYKQAGAAGAGGRCAGRRRSAGGGCQVGGRRRGPAAAEGDVIDAEVVDDEKK